MKRYTLFRGNKFRKKVWSCNYKFTMHVLAFIDGLHGVYIYEYRDNGTGEYHLL